MTRVNSAINDRDAINRYLACPLYTSDAADHMQLLDLRVRRSLYQL